MSGAFCANSYPISKACSTLSHVVKFEGFGFCRITEMAMRKRVDMTAAVFAAAIYIVVAFLPLSASGASAPKAESACVNFAGTSDMLPISRSMPTIVRSYDTSELPSLSGSSRFILLLAAAMLTTAVLSLSDAHYKERALKIQTARWCAS